MSAPAVSILVPVYNRAEMLRRALQSALEQSFADFEVVVVDNASTDGTWEICQEFASWDSRVRIHRNEQNIGLVRNSARCFELGEGRLGKVLYSDDVLYPDFLQKTVPLLDDPDIGLIFTDYETGASFGGRRMQPLAKPPLKLLTNTRFIDDECLASIYPVSPGAALFRMHDLRASITVGLTTPSVADFDVHGAGLDLLLFLRTAARYPKVARLCESLTFFLFHERSSSGSFPRPYLDGAYFQCKALFARETGNRGLLEALLAERWLQALRWERRLIPPDRLAADIFEDHAGIGTIGLARGICRKLFVRLRSGNLGVLFRKNG